MSRLAKVLLLVCAGVVAPRAIAQPPQKIKGPDERYKVDILVVVAHPDDEAAVTPYLARAIYDLHKSVAVVFGTRGGSGGNDYRREHGAALAEVREIEAREACGRLGIDKVWFLPGKDTASQNVLNSLANWGHGESLEELVRIVRLTRPEVILTWLPGIFIGENHGDHQAAGVLATEAFDVAGDPVAFPAQLAGASKRLEPYLENLTTWQPKKIYYFSDANDQSQFAGKGPAYSVKEISPSQKKPYYRLAIDAALPHLTQFPDDIERISKLGDRELERLMSDPHSAWWNDPDTLVFGKSVLPGNPTDDVFSGIRSSEVARIVPRPGQARETAPAAILAGPWAFYSAFRRAHALESLPVAAVPEIGIKSGSTLDVPVRVLNQGSQPLEITTRVALPENWNVRTGAGTFLLAEESSTDTLIEIDTPTLGKEQLSKETPREVVVTVLASGKAVGEVRLRVKLGANGLPQ